MDAAPPATLLLSRDRDDATWRLSRDRALHRVRPGAYVPVDEWISLPPWEQYRVRVEAVARTWSSPVFCLESAAPAHGLPLFGHPRHIHLLSRCGRSWREVDVVAHASRDARRVVLVEGMAVTGAHETTADLCRVLPPAFALAVGDAGARASRHAGDELDLDRLARGEANRRGVRQLRWVQRRMTPLAESVGESVSRAVISWLGFEDPELQVVFRHEGAEDRTDFYWRRLKAIGESDGYGKYDAPDEVAMKAHFVREKQREDRLRRHEGPFVRWDLSDAVAWRPLDEKLRVAGLRPVRLPQTARLATLADNPRSLTSSELARLRPVPRRAR